MELKKTHIYAYHEKHGNIVDFGGYALPVWYDSIIDEHNAVRNDVGIFDTSHMGRTMAVGPDTEKFINHLITNDVSKLGMNGAAPVAGVFTALADHNDILEEGQLIGRITDLDGSTLGEIHSPIDGIVHTMYVRRLVYPGDNLFTLLKIDEPTGW